MVTFEGTGGSHLEGCDIQLDIAPGPGGNPEPPVISATNIPCGSVTVNWTVGPPVEELRGSEGDGELVASDGDKEGEGERLEPQEGFRVFNGSSTNGPWTDVSGLLPPETRSFQHTGGAQSNNYYMVRAYTATGESGNSNVVLSNLIPCAPGLSARSDKDLVSVVGLINKNFSPEACSGDSDIARLPNKALFAPGDRVTFQINLCNTGEGTLTGISVLDTLFNLSSPSSYSSPQNCLRGTPFHDPTAHTISFDLNNIGPGTASDPEVCSIVFTATVTAPNVVNTAALYRFQNIADIFTNELDDVRVMTPPYLFSVGGRAPDRTETAP
jgi:uncharacterized repeat protein (TIGR01451 family)